MKRILAFICAAAFLCACSGDREHILKVYNWSDYIDESVIPEFEQWYEEQTGEPVHVICQTFDVNETMLAKIEKGHEDFDVVCPSDYIIERMLRSDMLLPIGRDFGDTPDYIEMYMSPYVRDLFSKIDGSGKNPLDYAVGYMWGTTGLIYNPKYVTDEEASTWDALRNPKFAGKIFVKDSARDVFSQVALFLHQDDLASGKVTPDELMRDSSDEALAEVEAFMADVKPLLAGWEADFGDDMMVQERGWLNLNWSGDAVWAMIEAEKVGVELRYSIPKEGCTVWFDGWVIPKYARNTKAARYWINFLNRPDIVIRNVDVTGYCSMSGAREVVAAFEEDRFEPVDLTYFFGPGADSVRVRSVLYPSYEEVSRSAMEHDWGDRTPALVEMWARVKGDSANAMTIVVISVFVLALVSLLLYKRLSSRKRRTKSRRR